MGMICTSCGKITEGWRGTFAQPFCVPCFEKQGKNLAGRQPPTTFLVDVLDSIPVKPLESAENTQKTISTTKERVGISASAPKKSWRDMGWKDIDWMLFLAGVVCGLFLTITSFVAIGLVIAWQAVK